MSTAGRRSRHFPIRSATMGRILRPTMAMMRTTIWANAVEMLNCNIPSEPPRRMPAATSLSTK